MIIILLSLMLYIVHVMLLGSIDNGCTLMLSTNMIALCFEICILSGGGGSGDDIIPSETSSRFPLGSCLN